jgi:TonB family protein
MLTIFSLSIVCEKGQMQKASLSFADVIYVLRSKKVSLSDRNNLLITAVRDRGIDFTLIEEFERELRKNGATPELIEEIRRKNPRQRVISAPQPIRMSAVPPPNSAFYRKRGDDYVGKGEYDRAILEYDEAIRLNPQDATAYYNRGFTYHYKNNQDRAFENYKTAIRLNSDLAQQSTMQCVLYNPTKTDNTNKAIEECSKTIDLASDFALAYYIRGKAYLNQEEPDRAIADYNKFIELNPKNALAYTSRGDAYWDKEDYDRAIADYNKAIDLDPSNETAKKNLQLLQAELLKNLQRLQAELLKFTENESELPISSERIDPPQTVSIGELNSRATKLVMPLYPEEAKRMLVQGKVRVQITIDEDGNVLSSKADSGHRLLRFYAESAARKSKFTPITFNNQPVVATGFIVYNFTIP